MYSSRRGAAAASGQDGETFMYEHIVEQAAERFGLTQDKAKQLLGMLIGVVFNAKRGGPAGFLKAFRDQELNDVVGSWVGHGPNQAISVGQLEDVLGRETLIRMSDKLGLPLDVVASASAAMLPEAVDALSEHGELPTGVGDRLKGWLGDTFDEIGHWGTAAIGASAAVLGAGPATLDVAVHKVGDAAQTVGDSVREAKSGSRKWLPWLLLAAMAIAAFVIFRSCQRRDTAIPETTPPASGVTTAVLMSAQSGSRDSRG